MISVFLNMPYSELRMFKTFSGRDVRLQWFPRKDWRFPRKDWHTRNQATLMRVLMWWTNILDMLHTETNCPPSAWTVPGYVVFYMLHNGRNCPPSVCTVPGYVVFYRLHTGRNCPPSVWTVPGCVVFYMLHNGRNCPPSVWTVPGYVVFYIDMDNKDSWYAPHWDKLSPISVESPRPCRVL